MFNSLSVCGGVASRSTFVALDLFPQEALSEAKDCEVDFHKRRECLGKSSLEISALLVLVELLLVKG